MAVARAAVRHVPEPYSLVAFLKGITKGLIENKPYAFLREWHNEHGPLLRVNMAALKVVSVADAQTVKWVTRNDPARFTKGPGYDAIKRGWLDNTIVLNEDEEWRRKRTLYTRAFKVAAIRSYVPLFFDIADAAASQWQRQHEGQRPVDAVRSFESVALESIGRAGFGVEGMGESGSRYAHAFTSYLRVLQDEISSPAMILLPRPLREAVTWLRGRHHLSVMNAESLRISEADSTPDADGPESGAKETRRNLVSLIREAAAEEGSGMDPEQLAREANLFLFAGHDTTSATMAWVFASLASHPEAQQRAYEEVAAIPAEDLAERVSDPRSLPFLGAVVKETLRLYPPAAMALRRTKFDEQLGGYDIPAGTNLTISIWCLQRDPKVFEDADSFKPERWIDAGQEELKSMQDHWLPFMIGARGCIGQHFAMMEMRIVIATLLRRFSVELASAPKLQQRMLLLPTDILLRCSPR